MRETAEPVPEKLFGSAKLARLIRDMTLALDRELEGVALAAPQLGAPYRLFIVRADRATNKQQPTSNKPDIQVYINPEIIKTSRRRAQADEGCLSIRGVYGTTKRHERVTIRARRKDGTKFQRGAGGLMAQVFEHEIDHLNGILFTDHAKRLIRIPHAGHPFAYFGTPTVASDTLAYLLELGFTPTVVITSPDAPRGRGLALTPSPTKTLALTHRIPVLMPEKLDAEAVAAIATLKCDYALCVAYGKLFPEELMQVFPKGVLNVHYSLLPKYRGATPLEAALLAGEEETGVTVQKMAKELDAGDILAQETVAIAPGDTARELRPRLISLGARLLVDTLPAYLTGGITPVVQDASRASRAYKIKKEDGLLSLDAPAEENWNKYRAYADTIGTYFFDNGKRIKITKASYKNLPDGKAGGKFIIERVIPEGKREVNYVTGKT